MQVFEADSENDISKEVSHIYSRVVGSVILTMAGLILFADKLFVAFGWELSNFYGMGSTEEFVAALGLVISPILILISIPMRPFFIAGVLPFYCYVLDLFHLFSPGSETDASFYVNEYMMGLTLISLFLYYLINRRVKVISELRDLKYNIMQEYVEADVKRSGGVWLNENDYGSILGKVKSEDALITGL